MIAIYAAMNEAVESLCHSQTPRLDTEILLSHTLGVNRTFLYTYPENMLTSEEWCAFQQLVSQRTTGIPVAYLTGHKEFWSLPLQVNEHTLIPRPETELLVEKTLSLLAARPSATILELGTGSGAIALALAKERPFWNIVACDIHQQTLNIAAANQEALGLANVQFYQSDWFSAIGTQYFDAIVANPPYLAEDDPHLQEDIRFEPSRALVSGKNGLQALNHIIQHARSYLNHQGILLVEHGATQKDAVMNQLKQCGYASIHCWQDWQNHDRVCSSLWS